MAAFDRGKPRPATTLFTLAPGSVHCGPYTNRKAGYQLKCFFGSTGFGGIWCQLSPLCSLATPYLQISHNTPTRVGAVQLRKTTYGTTEDDLTAFPL